MLSKARFWNRTVLSVGRGNQPWKWRGSSTAWWWFKVSDKASAKRLTSYCWCAFRCVMAPENGAFQLSIYHTWRCLKISEILTPLLWTLIWKTSSVVQKTAKWAESAIAVSRWKSKWMLVIQYKPDYQTFSVIGSSLQYTYTNYEKRPAALHFEQQKTRIFPKTWIL